MSPLDLCCSESLPVINGPGVNRVIVAFSGGVDSTCLLYLASLLPSKDRLIALHVNHQLHPDADHWQRHCELVCRSLDVPLTCTVVNVSRQGSLEAAARDARYAVFEAEVSPGDLLLLAHHSDDQVETVLFNLFRGHGATGLMGMPAQRTVGAGQLYRPLLGVRKAEMMAFCKARGLSWIEDGSNADSSLDRNFLRWQVIPALEARWPALGDTLLTALRRDSQAREVTSDIAAQDLAAACDRGDPVVSRLLELTPARRRNVLAWWIQSRRMPHPSAGLLDEMTHRFLSAAADAVPLLSWRGCELRRYRDRLYLEPEPRPLPAGQMESETAWPDPEIPLDLVVGELRAVAQPGAGLALAAGELCIRFRRGGEKIRLRGANRSLKKIFQERGVAPWYRSRLPLIYRGDQLVAIAGVAAWSLRPVTADDQSVRGASDGLEFWFSEAPSDVFMEIHR